MKRIKTAISLTLLATLGGVLTAPISSNAEWVQNPMGVPRAPGCDPGYSWQKVGVRYQCVTPQPSCQYGFASGPAWNGSGWIYSCNAPPPPPPVTPPAQDNPTTPDDVTKANCAARAAQDGITLGPLTNRIRYSSRGYSQWYYNNSIGTKYWTKSDGYTRSNVYEVVCTTDDATGAWANVGGAGPYAVFRNEDCMTGGGACGG
ncbi:hypothetical protein [Caballeronia sp. Lep1P3]|uniref:hypothetical protein n=1 Tax=Caballeronia sp. Lep1P3 TaxID=2878150 RepID=UPI001FD1B92D|nr:hypothetical protein [Caballeronia sp. Lep1P3]